MTIPSSIVVWIVATSAVAWLGALPIFRNAREQTTLAALVTALVLGSWVMLDNLSRPKSWELEFAKGETVVLAHEWVENEAIWIWVKWPGEAAPRGYTLPWSEETATALEKGSDGEEGEEGAETYAQFGEGEEGTSEHDDLDLPLYPSLEARKSPEVYTQPIPADPPKTGAYAPQRPVYSFGDE